ncbi:YadA-like family protein [Salmonella enterica subsp. enterica serovar Enteritidis]|uniref:YadA-like family protein n=2 Tax=Salmonella enterica TaxID=28901 RepID=UPI0013DF7341|nr:YadA-like family protein [Salmonella enterica]MCL9265901.1 YadA-like family protein [Salmonella enterica subsp. enterica serovar Enteritidis]MBJ2778463.1 YadA-like family protein [Salmonella enterica subsp. enterica serovar Derby]MBJ2990507.1 YadA-like family protein [Salmonella enterica subsp. enterica serovar Derby]MBJ3609884.1 YadA-like family protein [Salmonella enterica subsp. enterica serovar Derby]MBJ5039908.1 YadA-like family protein [Salmonella enterica subsp. enterica serovar Derb
MNKIFKVIWNPATGNFTVASETAKGRGKKSGRRKLLVSALVAGGLMSSFGASASVSLDGGTYSDGTELTDAWIAIGKGAKASSVGGSTASISIGVNAISAVGATAVGYDSHATGQSSVSMGQLSTAAGSRGVAIGSGASAAGDYTVALAVGSSASGESAVAIGQGSAAQKKGSVALGHKASSSGEKSVALGASSKATGDDSLALGRNALGNGTGSIAMGAESEANGLYSLAFGANSIADADNTVALGYGASATKAGAMVFGQAGKADGLNSIALGNKSQASSENSIAIGQESYSGSEKSIAIGSLSNVTGVNSVALGTESTAAEDNTVSVGNDTLQRKIVHMAKGDISSTSTDAINGSQLYDISKSVADRLGGGASVSTAGVVNAPNYKLQSGNFNNVGDALKGIDDNTLQWDSLKKVYSAEHGSDATSTITNVKDGALSASSTDAVNGSQLKTTNDNVATNTTNITNLTGDVANNTTNITNLTNDVAANTTSITNLTDTVTNLGEDALKWDDASGVFTAAHGTNATSKITNVKDGDLTTDSTDAVNGSQLKTTNDNVATNTTNITNLTGDVANNTTNITNLTNDVAANTTSITNLTDTVTNLGEDALKWDDASGVFTAAHGTNATSKITNVTAGTISSTSTDAVNGGQLFSLSDSLADYFGGNASVDENGVFTGPSYTIGSNSYDSVGDALAAINTSFSTSLGDALLWDETASAFSAGHGGNASKITNVANGAISETSTDAINGGQLYGVSNSVVDALGGNATVNADGSISAPTYSIANTDYNNVGDALDAIDSTLDDALLWDATAGENGAFSASRDGKASVITNVANGDISETSTDAINGSQLFATNTLINQQNEIINQIAGNTSETYIEENGAGLNYVRTNDTGLTFIDASASGTGATAVGYNAAASGESSVAIGQNSSSTVDTGIALGSSSVSSRVIAKSSRETSVTEDGVVIGYDTTDGELLGALSIGDDGKYRQIINVADGTEAHDAVTVRQLQNAIGAVTTTPTKYYHANSTEEDSLAVGTDSLAMGAKTIVNADAGIGIGLNTLVMADAINGIAIGSNARAYHANSIAMGNGSQTTRGAQTDYTAYNMDTPQNSVGEFSVGSEDGQRQITNVAAGSADTDAVNVSQLKVTDSRVAANTESINNLNTQVSSLDTRVTNIENGIGDIVTTGSTKYFKTNTDGADANAQGADSVAIGSGSIAAAENSVALGTNSVADEANTVSVGSSTQQRRITNVAAGVNNTDAVNVAQLKASEAGSVRYETNADGSVNYSVLNLGDGSGGTTRIGNVSAAVNDTDAVNYAQLKRSVEEANTYTDQKMGEMNSKIKGVENKMSGGIASAMAMAGLPQAYAPGANMTSIAGGTFNGESAVAIGVSMVSESGGWVYKLQGTSNSQGDYSAAIGAGFQW